MSGVIRSVLPLALTIIGGVIGGPWGAAIGSFIGSVAVATVLKPKVPNAPEAQAQTVGLDLGELGREAVFGMALTGGGMVDAFNWGGKYGTDWEALVIALADHRCEELVGFYINDEYHAFTGNGLVSGFNGKLYLKWYPGTEDQAVGDDMLAHGGYGANDNLAGISYVLASYMADASDEKNPTWTGGRPRFAFLLKGARIYQARKDSTVPGGSGPHRWNDPATWEWSDNPIDCRYAWVRGLYACDRIDQPGQLLIGRGLSAAEAPPENVAAPANICDELVAKAGGGSERRYRIGAVINALDQFDTVEAKFASACAGVILQPEGAIEIEPGHAKAPVKYITDADMVVGKPIAFSDFRSEADDEWCNTVIPRYVEPSQRWADHGAPIRRNTADLIADGGSRENTLQLPFVTSGTQAQRCGEIARRLGRLLRTATITLGPRFSELEEGDWIVWTSARRTKGLPVMWRIEAYALDEARQITIQLREINSTVYSWTAVDEIAPGATAEAQTPPDGYGVPDVGSWSLAGVSVGADGATQPGLTFSGAVEDLYVSAVRFEYRLFDTGNGPSDNWIDAGIAAPAVTARTLTSVESGQEYEGAVSYTFPQGQPGERLVLGPVTAGSLTVPGTTRGAHRLLSRTVAFPFSSDDTHIYISAFTGTIDTAETISFPGSALSGLDSGQSYGIFWSLSGSSYSAVAAPALSSMADSNLVFFEWWSTSDGGVYPPGETPPPGGGGDGYTPRTPEV
ncbi:phage tail protein [Sphingomonas hylomeconis]|uniref:Phage tail protein n=1 Tax=Sphingomonas hylomeconis TaxID=1395958 RepID=A0ABV7SSQ7_9SPHN|nr:phage tail protein [Sphingomonas hylomeconis]